MNRSVLCLASWLFAIGAFGPAARAQGTAGPGGEDALIKQGLDLRKGGDDEAALRVFRQAYARAKSGRAAAQMALAEQALGHWVDAEAHLIEALRHDEEPWIARHKAVLDRALLDIQKHLGSLQLSGGVAGATVTLNGAPAGTLTEAVSLRAPAGTVVVEVGAPGYLPVVRSVVIPAGGIAREAIVLIRMPEATTTAAPASNVAIQPSQASAPRAIASQPPSDHRTTRKTVGVALVAAGLVGLATGITFSVTYDRRARAFNDAGCYTSLPNDGPEGCRSRHQSVTSAEYLFLAGYASAAVLGGIGAYLLLAGPSEAGSSVALSAGRSGPWSVRCLPASDAGIMCGGRF